MRSSLTLDGQSWPRTGSFVCGIGMAATSLLTIRHYFQANFPSSIYAGTFCDFNAFFNCDSSAFSVISQVAGVPLGYFGFVLGALVVFGALFPSKAFEQTNRALAGLNALGVVGLFLFSVLYLRSLCLLCAGYYLFSVASFALFMKFGSGAPHRTLAARCLMPSWHHLTVFACVTLLGAYGLALFHQAKEEAQEGGVSARIVQQYFELPLVRNPSTISPYFTARATDRFEDAPIQVIEYGDFLCSDCRYLHEQLTRLKREFEGKINIAFQFFPLDAQCNDVVDKNKHPGACDLSYYSAYRPQKFLTIHDEIFANLAAARDPGWRQRLAEKYGVEGALQDAATKERVHRIIQTGREYARTSEKFPFGIRSTPTMIVNNRMIIGTLPYAQLRAIFNALVAAQGKSSTVSRPFIENWVP